MIPSPSASPKRARRRAGVSLRAIVFLAAVGSVVGCDSPPAGSEPASSAPSASPSPSRSPAPSSTAPVEAPAAIEIIVDRAHVDVGKTRVAGGRGLADRVATLVRGAPGIEGRTPDAVAMRGAAPSDVAAVVDALRQARAVAVNVKTEARDSTTQSLPLSFPTRVADCTAVAWIAKDASLQVWPAGGGTAKRVLRGLAGPDVTLGMEAVRALQADCESSVILVGADDAMTWGLVFDVATSALHAPWARARAAVLLPGASPGHKIALP